MTVWRKILRQTPDTYVSMPTWWYHLGRLISQSTWLQAVIAASAGGMIGVYVLGTSTLSPRLMMLAMVVLLGGFFAVIVGNIRKLLLAVIVVEITFPIDIYLNYQTALADIGALGGLNISVTTMCLGALYALWLGNALIGSGDAPRPRWFVNPPLLLYLAWVALSIIVAGDKMLSVFEIFLLLQTFLLYIYIVSTIQTREEVVFIVTILLITLLLESLVMIGLRGIGRSIEIANILTARIDPGGRVGGTVGSPNGAGGYLSLLLAPALSIWVARWVSWHRVLALSSFGLGVIALIFTLSRGGWLAFGISMFLLGVISWRRGWLSYKMPALFVSIGCVMALVFHDTILSRLLGDDRGSAESRLPLIDLAFQIIKDHPFVGAGANNFAPLIQSYDTPEFGGVWLYVVHNKYLLIWAETGFISLIAFIAFLVWTIYYGWRASKTAESSLAPLVLALSVAIVGHMFHLLFDLFNARTQIQLLWLCAAIIMVIARISTAQDETAKLEDMHDIARKIPS
jgi:O-antigen ligase